MGESIFVIIMFGLVIGFFFMAADIYDSDDDGDETTY